MEQVLGCSFGRGCPVPASARSWPLRIDCDYDDDYDPGRGHDYDYEHEHDWFREGNVWAGCCIAKILTKCAVG